MDVTDPGIREFLAAGERLYPPDAVSFTLAEQRAFYDRYCAHFRKERPQGINTQDFHIGKVPCRAYRKQPSDAVLLYLHGGGFILGGLESHDDICAELCDGAGVDVVAVDYRLAPEHPFPAAFDDCWTVLTFLKHERVIVGGDSAGGNLAAALALKARDQRLKLAGQVLIYPGLGGDVTRGSYVTLANASGLTTKDVLYYRDVYKGGHSKFAEPLRETNFEGVAPAFLVAAGLDPLHDDCQEYAAKLPKAHVRDEPLLVHSFLRARHMSEPAGASFHAIIDSIKSFAA